MVRNTRDRRLLGIPALFGAALALLLGSAGGAAQEDALRPRFLREATAAPPLSYGASGPAVYDALDWRRLRLWQDQQVPQWTPPAVAG
jgi:hypothetical protein